MLGDIACKADLSGAEGYLAGVPGSRFVFQASHAELNLSFVLWLTAEGKKCAVSETFLYVCVSVEIPRIAPRAFGDAAMELTLALLANRCVVSLAQVKICAGADSIWT